MRALSGVKEPDLIADPIIHHPAVRTMLLTMKAYSEGGRSMVYECAKLADQMLDGTNAQERATWTAYADGVNAYTDRVRSGEFPAPAELEAAYLFLGVENPVDLMLDWGPLQLAGVGSTVNFVSGFETTDISNQSRVEQLEELLLHSPVGLYVFV